MPFTLIKGNFVPNAGFPDGDSVRFRPDDASPLFALPRKGRPPRVNANNGTIQLRYEGIDTLEKDAIEPHASNATAMNLEMIGFADGEDEPAGYILANQIGPNGRPICFVYAGAADEDDGSRVFLDEAGMEESVNFKLLEAGAAYPLFYDTLFGDLRSAMAEAAATARKARRGLWPHDETKSGVTWGGADSLDDLPPIFPKLWRRLEKYTQNRDFRDESDELDDFIDYLQAVRDRLFVLSDGRFTDLDNIVEVDGDVVRLPFCPEDLVFVS